MSAVGDGTASTRDDRRGDPLEVVPPGEELDVRRVGIVAAGYGIVRARREHCATTFARDASSTGELLIARRLDPVDNRSVGSGFDHLVDDQRLTADQVQAGIAPDRRLWLDGARSASRSRPSR